MQYPGFVGEVLPGDRVLLGADEGIVVFSIDANLYVDGFARSEWAYLQRGVMIDFAALGLVHIAERTDELSLLERATPAGTA